MLKRTTLIILAFLFGCNTFTSLEAPSPHSDSGSDVGRDVRQADDVARSDFERDGIAEDTRRELVPFDDSFQNDWFISVIPSPTPRLSDLSMVRTPSQLLIGMVESGNSVARTAVINTPRSFEFEEVFSLVIGQAEVTPTTADIQDPVLEGLYLSGGDPTSAMVSFDRVRTNVTSEVAVFLYDWTQISEVDDFVSIESPQPVSGFRAGIQGGDDSKISIGTERTHLVATNNAIYVNGERISQDLEETGTFILTGGPLAGFADYPDYFFFDTTNILGRASATDAATRVLDFGFVGHHGTTDLDEYVIAQDDGGFNIGLRNVALTADSDYFPEVEVPGNPIQIPEIIPSLIKVVPYFHPDDDVPDNPANAAIVSVEAVGADAYIAVRIVLVENQNFELIACRRFRITVEKTELEALTYDLDDDLVVVASTIYEAANDMSRFGFDGFRFPGLFVPDADLQNPYDPTCQDIPFPL